MLFEIDNDISTVAPGQFLPRGDRFDGDDSAGPEQPAAHGGHEADRPLGEDSDCPTDRNRGIFGARETGRHHVRGVYGRLIGDRVRNGSQIGGRVIDAEILGEDAVLDVGELPTPVASACIVRGRLPDNCGIGSRA